MDESSAVLPSPDAGDYGDDSSGISATDFHVPSSPTKARPDSQISASSSSPHALPPPPPPLKSAAFQSPIPEEGPSKGRSYLYGRPLPRYSTPPAEKPSSTFGRRLQQTNRPLPITSNRFEPVLPLHLVVLKD